MLETACAMPIADAFWVHGGSKAWAQESLFGSGFRAKALPASPFRGPFQKDCARFRPIAVMHKRWSAPQVLEARRRKDAVLKADNALPGLASKVTAERPARKAAEILPLDAAAYSMENVELRTASADARRRAASSRLRTRAMFPRRTACSPWTRKNGCRTQWARMHPKSRTPSGTPWAGMPAKTHDALRLPDRQRRQAHGQLRHAVRHRHGADTAHGACL